MLLKKQFTGYVLLSVLFVLLWVGWSMYVTENDRVMESVAGESGVLALVTRMRNITHKRTIKLYEMTLLDDAFEQDKAYMEIRKLGAEFVQLRDTFLHQKLSSEELAAWSDARIHLNKRAGLIHQIAGIAYGSDRAGARFLLLEKLIPAQKRFMQGMDRLSEVTRQRVGASLVKISEKNKLMHGMLATFGSACIFLCFLIFYFSGRSQHMQEGYVEQGERIRALYELSSRSDLNYDEQITETLRLGCKLLNMEVGKVGQLDEQAATSTFLNTVAPADMNVKRGTVLPLANTYCNLTFASEKPVALNHVGQSQYRNDACYRTLKMEAYIGTTILVNGKKFGTVHFSNRKPRPPFSQADVDLLRLMGNWVAMTMERQIAEQELIKSRQEAEQANLFKSQFLANMSHEIRTPMTAILGYAELLKIDLDIPSLQNSKDVVQSIETILRSGNHLLDIINDILDLSKIEAGKLEVEYVPLSPVLLLEEIQYQIHHLAVASDLEFRLDYDQPIPKTIHSDPTRLRQILLNLCGNAVKFTEKGTVELIARYLPKSGHMQFIVRDTGIGLSEEEIERIFQPFTQADQSITRKFGGTGLGLSISTHLAELLGGGLTVDSKKGEGSQFTLTIAANMDMASPGEGPVLLKDGKSPSAPRLEGVRILLVDDHEDIRKLISLYVHKTGARADLADNGETALEKALKRSYDLIFMDVNMPVMDGVRAVIRLRENGYSLPIVMMTAGLAPERIHDYKDAGADAVIAKPVDLACFYRTMEELVAKRTVA